MNFFFTLANIFSRVRSVPCSGTCVRVGLLFLLGLSTFAQVERLEITARLPLENGKKFGQVGTYEIVLATAHLAIDPKAKANEDITDLDLAVPDADGLVRYRAEVFLIRPMEPSRSNGCLLVDIPNRGNPVTMFFNYPEYMFRGTELPPSITGDGFLMKQGFTLAGVGWQSDAPPSTDPRFVFELEQPPTRDVEGLVRTDTVFSNRTRTMELGHWGHKPYPVANPADPRHLFTVRDSDLDKRRVIPRDQWKFARWEKGNLETDLGAISLVKGEFEKGKIYEIVYVSNKPRIVGLGMTAIRDVISYLRHHGQSPVRIDRTIAYGASQTGRLLRHYLYLGLNADLDGKRVLDGVFASVAGAGRGSFNHRFAQPSRAAVTFEMFAFPSDLFPFSGQTQQDSLTGLTDGLLTRLADSEAMPKVFFVNTGYEYWGRAASLLHTSPDGKEDKEPLAHTRIYHFSSVQHGPARFPLTNVYLNQPNQKIAGRKLLNPANYIWCDRALVLALDDWVAHGREPPPSQIPSIAKGSLVAYKNYRFPAIPGVKMPKDPHLARDFDYGDRFRSHGIMDRRPPRLRQSLWRPGSSGKRGRQRNSRFAPAGNSRAPCHPHLLEPARSRNRCRR